MMGFMAFFSFGVVNALFLYPQEIRSEVVVQLNFNLIKLT